MCTTSKESSNGLNAICFQQDVLRDRVTRLSRKLFHIEDDDNPGRQQISEAIDDLMAGGFISYDGKHFVTNKD